MSLTAARSFLDHAAAALTRLVDAQAPAFEAAAEALTRTIAADGQVYLFGTGHSHMLAEEGHYRAGGLACIVPILDPPLMLHEGAVESTRRERESGLAAPLFARYGIEARDVVVIFSNSGVNAVPVEAAQAALATGATVIGVTSEAYSRQAAAGRPRLAEMATIAIDNGIVPGDASFHAAPGLPPVGPLSTIVCAAILDALIAEAVSRLHVRGVEAPIYVSANMPGGAARNVALVARYKARNPHL